MKHTVTRTKRKQRGVAAVELGLVMIPLTVLAFGITEYGRAIFQYNTLVKSVRDASRHLSQHAAGDATQIAIAKCLVVHGNRNCSGAVLVPGLSASLVEICDRSNCADHANQPTGAGVVNLVTVTVDKFPFKSLVPLMVSDLTFGAIRSTMRQVL
ncbi:MAG TPA: TadE/TadG family type IV pilus assembly protein [Burkholderiaceae bacterium]|nr:TadE/TadG family type IV pilus assembly protein [Burkholderiaceae bacterium]